MRIAFVYPAFERHADSHPELRALVPCHEYLGPPSLGIAYVAGATPPEHEVVFVDDRLHPFDPDEVEADLYALSFFTPAATRGLEIGTLLLERGKPVVMGGIFPTHMPAVAEQHCTSVVVGEGEAVWPQVLDDFARGGLAPRYDSPPSDLARAPSPRLDLYFDAERDGHRPDDYPFQLSRGCPLSCDACAVPGSMGRRMRFHTDDHLRGLLGQFAHAKKQISLTEDTSFLTGAARQKLRRFVDLVLTAHAEGLDLRLSYLGISMPMILHLDGDLLTELKKTGLDRFYLVGGFDPVTRTAFGTGDQAETRKAELAIARCQDAGIDPYVSFLVGNPTDDEGTFDRMLEFARRTRIDLAEFCVSTPYPGTPIWHRYEHEGRIFDRTWKRYNDANVVFRPHQMSVERLTEGYLSLWREFYRGREDDLGGRETRRRTIQF